MNKDNDSSYSGDPESPSQVSGLAGSISSPARRKLIKIGASSVPVLATLTSQSALAANCISTSAWGSDQISGSASQRARHEANGFPVIPRFTISQWNVAANPVSKTTDPWIALRDAYSLGSSFRQNTVTFTELKNLLLAKFTIPTAFSPGANVVGSLGNNDQSFFVVAQLNFAANLKPPAGFHSQSGGGRSKVLAVSTKGPRARDGPFFVPLAGPRVGARGRNGTDGVF